MNKEKIKFKISDCPELKKDIEKMQKSYQQELDQYKNKIEYYENFEINKTVDKIRLRHNKEIKELYQKIDQYKNNWEELKTYLNMVIGMNFNMNNDQLSEQKVDDYTNILNKMKELEKKTNLI